MAVSGIGIDTVEISRIKEAIESNRRFVEKMFSKTEIEYCEKKINLYESYAARFAAKEAFSKALGTGFGKEFSWKDIEIINNHLGKPEIKIINSKLTVNEGKVFLSITHTKETATAFVIIEK
jgi:holo-[acyl-carrier protein] synthase